MKSCSLKRLKATDVLAVTFFQCSYIYITDLESVCLCVCVARVWGGSETVALGLSSKSTTLNRYGCGWWLRIKSQNSLPGRRRYCHLQAHLCNIKVDCHLLGRQQHLLYLFELWDRSLCSSQK